MTPPKKRLDPARRPETPPTKVRVNLDLSEESIAGWHAMGEVSGASLTALAEVVGLWFQRLADGEFSEKQVPLLEAFMTEARKRAHRRR